MLIDREQTYKILCEEYPLLQKEYLRRVIDKIPTVDSLDAYLDASIEAWNEKGEWENDK